jgi:hypothetical protein
MRRKYDTSININNILLKRVRAYSKATGISKQEIILTVLSHFIKRTKRGIFLKSRTVGYQEKNGNYKKLTLHLDSKELEIFRQIRVVTLLSTSYVFFIGMELFGDKLFKRAKKSKWVLKRICNYFYLGSYPEYVYLTKKTLALSRYWITYT